MEDFVSESTQQTAKQALKILVAKNEGFIEPTNTIRTNILIAFAKKNKVVYGKAFDVIKINSLESVNLDNLVEVEKNLHKITIYEIKSTNKKSIILNFNRYFFSLSTAELLVAQSLKHQFKFVFVNINTLETLELDLKEVFQKAKGIYPSWSIQF